MVRCLGYGLVAFEVLVWHAGQMGPGDRRGTRSVCGTGLLAVVGGRGVEKVVGRGGGLFRVQVYTNSGTQRGYWCDAHGMWGRRGVFWALESFGVLGEKVHFGLSELLGHGGYWGARYAAVHTSTTAQQLPGQDCGGGTFQHLGHTDKKDPPWLGTGLVGGGQSHVGADAA